MKGFQNSGLTRKARSYICGDLAERKGLPACLKSIISPVNHLEIKEYFSKVEHTFPLYLQFLPPYF
jgi:hypothetical protein